MRKWPPHVLLAGESAPPPLARVVQDLEAGLGAGLGRVDEPARLPVHDLGADPTHVAGHRRAPLPERLAHREPEALLDRLLDHGLGVHLERVHLDRADVVEVREDVDVGVVGGVGDGLVVEVPALRVVVRHRADERELHVGNLVLHEPVGVDHAERVLPGVEPGDLRQQRPADVDPELVDDVRGVLGRERHVLRGERIDRRRPDVALRQPRRAGHVLAQVEDGGVVAADRGQQEVHHRRVRRREVDVAAPDPACGRVREVVDHRHGLRVVDDDDVVVVGEVGRVLGVVAGEDLLLLRRQPLRIALDRVVDRLRDVEELVLARDDPPLHVRGRRRPSAARACS